MPRIIDNGLQKAIIGTDRNGGEVQLAFVRSYFNIHDYLPGTCPPRLIALTDIGLGGRNRPQSIAHLFEVGALPGQSRFHAVPVMERAPDIVNAFAEAGFAPPPVKIPARTAITRFLRSALIA